jgi:Flp pilus assembly pilin Flp
MIPGDLPKMIAHLHNLWVEDDGQDLVEYSLLLVFMVLSVMSLVTAGLPTINAIWQKNNGNLTAANSSATGN